MTSHDSSNEAQRVQRLQAELKQSQRLAVVARLADAAGHDFNNLISVIAGYCDLLLHNPSTSDNAKLQLRQIADAAERSGQLAQRLTRDSWTSANRIQRVRLDEWLNHYRKMLTRLVGDVSTTFCPEGQEAMVLVDPVELAQAATYLCENAVQAMPGGGSLVIATGKFELAAVAGALEPGSFAALSVTDTGCGIATALGDRIFEPFVTANPGHLGLGLTYARQIVRSAGGEIVYESRLGHGSVFRLLLPMIGAGGRLPINRPTVATKQAARRFIVVAEDEPNVRDIVTSVLEQDGCRVLAVEDGAAALKMLQAHAGEVDLLVSDVVMPNVDGIELMRKVATYWPELRVLFISGYSESPTAIAGFLARGAGYLPKPFTPPGLLQAAHALMDMPGRPVTRA